MLPKLVNIVFPLPLNQAYTYTVPDDLRPVVALGTRVVAPFGRRTMTGFAVDFPTATNLDHLKDIQDVLDPSPIVSTEMRELCRWLGAYYLCSFGEALRVTVPASLLQKSRSVVDISTDDAEAAALTCEKNAPRQAQLLRYLAKARRLSLAELKKRVGAKNLVSSLNHLEERGLIRQSQYFSGRKTKPRMQKYVGLVAPSELPVEEVVAHLRKTAPRQAQCLEFLNQKEQPVSQKELLQATGASSPVIKALAQKGLLALSEKVVFRDYYDATAVVDPPDLTLNQEQATALSRISQRLQDHEFATFLLYGVTGSGKTQVYIEAIKKTLRLNRGAIVLVPEIALTPQTVSRFQSHFRDLVAVLHSAMSEGERFDSWQRIRAGKARVVIGPRSAIFAPIKALGLIVVDEEHEATYKQTDQTPRYHARDVAVVRAKSTHSVVILGSATPSAESFHNAQGEKYELLKLERRVNDVPLPEVKLIDMVKEKRMSGKREEPVFSRLLARKIEEKIARREQVILLLNRRGFSSYIKCKDCGFLEQCSRCDISLTYHLRGHRLRCHYCGYSKKAPSVCPDCHSSDILFRGLGTQKVEDALKDRFPQARMVRMDLDTTSRKKSHDRILNDFGAGKYDILLGTQMVAKGLDFSRVTLVGVINADVGMLLPDFRASERTFQLITQVAGRAGRKELKGEVIIQTYSPESFCLTCASTHDFQKFYAEEILDRHALHFPPFGRLICIHFRGEDEGKVELGAARFASMLLSRKGSFEVLGPTTSPMNKLKDQYRYQILIKINKRLDPKGSEAKRIIRGTELSFRKKFGARGVKVTVDVDPVSIL